jgi:hypothetical protein
MRKRGQGAICSCSSGKSTPRAVERTTWLGRGPTVAIGRDFCWLKTRWALISATTLDLAVWRSRTRQCPVPLGWINAQSRVGPPVMFVALGQSACRSGESGCDGPLLAQRERAGPPRSAALGNRPAGWAAPKTHKRPCLRGCALSVGVGKCNGHASSLGFLFAGGPFPFGPAAAALLARLPLLLAGPPEPIDLHFC